MPAGRSPDLSDQVAEAVDHRRSQVEPGRAVDEAERLDPALDAVEIAELVLERGEDREGGEPRGLVAALSVTSVPTFPATSTSVPSTGPWPET